MDPAEENCLEIMSAKCDEMLLTLKKISEWIRSRDSVLRQLLEEEYNDPQAGFSGIHKSISNDVTAADRPISNNLSDTVQAISTAVSTTTLHKADSTDSIDSISTSSTTSLVMDSKRIRRSSETGSSIGASHCAHASNGGTEDYRVDSGKSNGWSTPKSDPFLAKLKNSQVYRLISKNPPAISRSVLDRLRAAVDVPFGLPQSKEASEEKTNCRAPSGAVCGLKSMDNSKGGLVFCDKSNDSSTPNSDPFLAKLKNSQVYRLISKDPPAISRNVLDRLTAAVTVPFGWPLSKEASEEKIDGRVSSDVTCGLKSMDNSKGGRVFCDKSSDSSTPNSDPFLARLKNSQAYRLISKDPPAISRSVLDRLTAAVNVPVDWLQSKEASEEKTDTSSTVFRLKSMDNSKEGTEDYHVFCDKSNYSSTPNSDPFLARLKNSQVYRLISKDPPAISRNVLDRLRAAVNVPVDWLQSKEASEEKTDTSSSICSFKSMDNSKGGTEDYRVFCDKSNYSSTPNSDPFLARLKNSQVYRLISKDPPAISRNVLDRLRAAVNVPVDWLQSKEASEEKTDTSSSICSFKSMDNSKGGTEDYRVFCDKSNYSSTPNSDPFLARLKNSQVSRLISKDPPAKSRNVLDRLRAAAVNVPFDWPQGKEASKEKTDTSSAVCRLKSMDNSKENLQDAGVPGFDRPTAAANTPFDWSQSKDTSNGREDWRVPSDAVGGLKSKATSKVGGVRTEAACGSKDKGVSKKDPKDDGVRAKVVAVVLSLQSDDGFLVKIEQAGLYANRRLKCYNRHLSDSTTPIIPFKTRLSLAIKVLQRDDRDEVLIIIWANVLDYSKLAPSEIRSAFAGNDNHESFVEKLYFSWRPFLNSILTHAYDYDQETMMLVLTKILPSDEDSSYSNNSLAELRSREIIELFSAPKSMFLFRLGQLESCDGRLVKHLARLVTLYTKELKPVTNLLEKYYMDDPEGVIGLVKNCYSDSAPQCLTALSFRNVPLIPVMDELAGVISTLLDQSDTTVLNLLELESHLIPNRVDGPWESAEEFLNVHFRLLREECFASIRNRIACLRIDPENQFYVYRNVTVIGFAISEGTIVVQLNYKSHKGQKNLMFGNLLCIDVDTRFSSPIWATVKSSEPKSTVISVVIVGEGNNFAGENNSTDDLPSTSVISAIQHLLSSKGVMVESPTYYHAFKPVLSRLQSLNERVLPFQSEILLQSTEPKESTLNLPPLVTSPQVDESQRQAAKTALSYRFTLIQGPPGCGKTYVAKEIIKIILKNKEKPIEIVINPTSGRAAKKEKPFIKLLPTENSGPILLMTYKNHALDNMIEGCLEFTTSVVRIGGKSKSEAASEYNLHNLYTESRLYYSQEDFKKLQEAKGCLRVLGEQLKNTAAGSLLNDFTAINLYRFLLQQKCKQQLHSLVLKDFEEHYSAIIGQQMKYDNFEEVDQAVTDILGAHQILAAKLVRVSLKAWLPERDVAKFLSDPRSLFLNNDSPMKLKKDDTITDDDDEEIDDDVWDDLMAERQVGAETELEFTTVSQNRKTLYPALIDRMVCAETDRRELEVRDVRDVWTLSPEGRYVLMSYWFRKWREEKDEDLAKALENYNRFNTQVKQLQARRNVNFLKSRDLVGCTITGCCLRMGLITEMAPSVVIVEEAAEILEGQLIAALPSSVKHLILIGDHKQLPPQINHYRLAKQFNLGVSIFERLANNGYPVCQLKVHRRGPKSLLPLFSRFYDEEIEAVKEEPILPEALKEMGTYYWWTHSAPSRTADVGTSYENEFEAEMLVGAVRFLIMDEKVEAARISIITGYLAQANIIKNLLAHCSEEVGVCTIDQFQGDENDFIFLSLTRSVNECEENGKSSLGFLSSANRTCVALSRARKGLYIFGNSRLCESYSSWKPAVEYFNGNERLGTELKFVVDGKKLIFTHPNDFQLFFKELELQKRAMKAKLWVKYIRNRPVAVKDGVSDVTSVYGKKIEMLMNGSVLNYQDLGLGRDAHGDAFKSFRVKKVHSIFNTHLFTLYMHHMDIIEKNKPPPLGFTIDTMQDWMKETLNDKVNEFYLFHGTKKVGSTTV